MKKMLLRPSNFVVIFIIIVIALIVCCSEFISAGTCTIAQDCNGHASAVSGDKGSCVCNCVGQWSGMDCSQCDTTRYNISRDCSACLLPRGHYPTCAPGSCSSEADCNGRAVTDPSGNRSTTGCDTCSCRNAWSGSTCSVCPEGVSVEQNCGACKIGYTNYPQCSLKCTTANNCSYHATSVTGTSASGCTCSCRNAWSSSDCSVCPNSTTAGGFWNPDPDCVTCQPGYSGTECKTRVCDVIADCNGNAVSVSGNPGSCVCVCKNHYSGLKCETCPTGFNKLTDCDRCASGFGPLAPVCAPKCTNADDCSGHASALSGFRPNCSCACSNQWSGSKCETCSFPYTGSNCNTCTSGYDTYPTCSLSCTVADNCSSTGTSSVSGNSNTGCTCSCKNRYSGSKCQTCATKYDSTKDCNACAPDYDQSSFPNCYKLCTVAANCNSHASTVSGNIGTGCTCSCYGQWKGSTCGTCASGINKTADPTNPSSLGCDRCVDGFSGYPKHCGRACTIQRDCFGHATNVSGNEHTGCTCSCINQWKGSDCNICGTLYNKSDNCASCVFGAQGYPNCYRDCDITLDCNGNAASVTGTTKSGCTCTCRNLWSGATCNTCADKYTNDCSECAATYGGTFPFCYPFCNVEYDCNGRAPAVSGVRPNCSCSCNAGWSSETNCASCPSNYALPGCTSCAPGLGPAFPVCSPQCNVAEDCSGSYHSSSASGFRATGCSCSCRYQWKTNLSVYVVSPPSSSSNNNNNTSNNSSTTLAPTTTTPAPATKSISISATTPGCNYCPEKYDSRYNCRRCKAPRINYPRCALPCNASDVCSNHGYVYGDQQIGCSCRCRNRWTLSSNCSVCPAKYDATRDCRYCNEGYSRYPYCYKKCTNEVNCNGNAQYVWGDYGTGCYCSCRNMWRGITCSLCSSRHNKSNDCGSCLQASLQKYYPHCYLRCKDVSCPIDAAGNYNRTKLHNIDYNSCRCNCPITTSTSTTTTTTTTTMLPTSATTLSPSTSSANNNNTNTNNSSSNSNETSSSSSSAATPTATTSTSSTTTSSTIVSSSVVATTTTMTAVPSPTTSCSPFSICAPGFGTEANNCSLNNQCSLIADCYGNGISVRGNLDTQCNCTTCRNRWSGVRCSQCASKYDYRKDCGRCSSGHESYPYCYKKCSNYANCSSRAWYVSGNEKVGCNCRCRNKWYNPTCSSCRYGYDPARDCRYCLKGFAGSPCSPVCTISGNCTNSNHTYSVSGTYLSGCTCRCRNAFTGTKCQTCPSGYSAALNCAACAANYSGYPTCARNCDARDCNFNSVSASGTITTGCTCSCRNYWFGATCNACPTNFNKSAASDCSKCIDGYHVKGSKCVRTCSLQTDCSGHAFNVTGDGSIGCTCACRSMWKGTKCDSCQPQFNKSEDCATCSAGYVPRPAFPICLGKCYIDKHCNNHAVSVYGDTSHGCVCSCAHGWKSSRCQSCPTYFDSQNDCSSCIYGYSGYPDTCRRSCSVNTDCNSHATSVTGFVSYNTTCSCSCATPWIGAKCNICPARYDPNFYCSRCNSGYEGTYPNCYKKCSTVADCSNHAYAVTGNSNTGCSCSCSGKFYGDKCQNCSPLYDQQTCSNCVTGLFEDFPNCYKKCDLSKDCSGTLHAISVTGNVNTGCACTCRNSFSGSNCELCDEKYEQTRCKVCRAGLTNYPACTRQCSSALDCSGNAASVEGVTSSYNNGPECKCTCKNSWFGNRCNKCPSRIDSSTGCSSCLEQYDTYPHCYLTCTGKSNCSGHALSVVGNEKTGCNCSCINQWYGDKCDKCPSGIDKNANCGSCLPNFDGYPSCKRDCVYSDCSNHATEVAGDTLTGCRCKCRNFWTNTTCNICGSNLDSSNDCGSCASGFSGTPPNCSRPCNLFSDCHDHAAEVIGDWTNCQCSCRAHWEKPRCEICPWPFDGTRDCSECLPFYENYPSCSPTCTVQRNCSDHADSVLKHPALGCLCSCRNLWEGSKCQNCASHGNISNDCLPNGEEPVTPTTTTIITTTTSSLLPSTTQIPRSSTTATTLTSSSPKETSTSTSLPPASTTTEEATTTTATTTQSSSTLNPETTTTTATSQATTTNTAIPVSSSTSTNPTELTSSTTQQQQESTTTSISPTTTSSTTPTTTTNHQQEETSSTTVTPTTTTTTLAPCTLDSSSCDRHGTESVTGVGSNCDCLCKNRYISRLCNICSNPPYNNSDKQCNSCVRGFVEKSLTTTTNSNSNSPVICVCARFVRVTVQLPAAADSSLSSPSSSFISDLTSAAKTDAQTIISQSSCSSSSSITTSSSQVSVTSISLVGNSTHPEYQFSFNVLVKESSSSISSYSCNSAIAFGNCVSSSKALGKEKFPCSEFSRTTAIILQNNNNNNNNENNIHSTSCVVLTIAPASMSLEAGCFSSPTGICAAPTQVDKTNFNEITTPPTPFPTKIVLIVAGAILALLLLIVLILFLKKRGVGFSYGVSRFSLDKYDEPDVERFHTSFNIGAAGLSENEIQNYNAFESMVNDHDNNGAGEEMLLGNSFNNNSFSRSSNSASISREGGGMMTMLGASFNSSSSRGLPGLPFQVNNNDKRSNNNNNKNYEAPNVSSDLAQEDSLIVGTNATILAAASKKSSLSKNDNNNDSDDDDLMSSKYDKNSSNNNNDKEEDSDDEYFALSRPSASFSAKQQQTSTSEKKYKFDI